MTRARAAVRLWATGLAIALAAACHGDTIQTPPVGHAAIKSRSDSLAVGDTMTLVAGVQYNDGRFFPFDSSVVFTVDDTTTATVTTPFAPNQHILFGKQAGTVHVRVSIQRVGSFSEPFYIF